MPTSAVLDSVRWTPELEAQIQSAARDAGFELAGIAAADSDQTTSRFEAWVAAGRAGEMEYLKRRDADGSLLRSGLRVAIPWARSVIVCAFNYDSPLASSLDAAPPGSGWIGRYAWSGRREMGSDELLPIDYHDDLLSRLKFIEGRLLESVSCESRCYVDTGPILERDFAAKAGIGWIGKNTCVINQEVGSWLLLGVIVTSLPLAPEAKLNIAADRCGSCTRCIDACPTDALVAVREMDASRCIAYLTIEKKGSIAPELREGIGRQVFGCDICQDVCPWNKKDRGLKDRGESANRAAAAGVPMSMETRQELVNPELAWLAEMDSKSFKRWFKGSPLYRTGRKRLHRNVAIAMGNSASPEFLPQLRQWADGEDDVLAESAVWAIKKIQSASI